MKNLLCLLGLHHKWEKKSIHSYNFEDEEIFKEDKRYKNMEVGKGGCHGEGLRFIKVCKVCGKEKAAPIYM